MNRTEFMEQAAQAAYFAERMTPDYRFDANLAWDVYEAIPERWHARTEDNPDGDPVVALILEDGPWWVTA